jgi:hypothetical protein
MAAIMAVRHCARFISFWRCCGEGKTGRIRRVKYRRTAVAILALLSTSLALAEDFKTVNGKEYKDATVSHVESDGIVLRTRTGISKVYFVELPKDVQERFGYDPAKAAQLNAAAQAAAAQAAAAQFTTATPQQQTQIAFADLHTIREVESDQPKFLDQPFVLKGTIEISSFYLSGYGDAQQSHYAFKIVDSAEGRCDAYMERAKAGKLRQQLLDAGSPLKGVFTVALLSSRYKRSAWLDVELLDCRLEQ